MKFDPLVQLTISIRIAWVFLNFAFLNQTGTLYFIILPPIPPTISYESTMTAEMGSERESYSKQTFSDFHIQTDPPKIYYVVKKAHAVTIKISALQFNST